MDIIEIIETAIKDEQDAQVKYKEASDLAPDSKTRNVFLQLRKDEAEHERKLKDRLTALNLLKTD